MKVLITTDWYKPTVNGVVTSVVSLAAGLRALGHEVKILTLSRSCHSFCREDVTFLGSVGAGRIYPDARFRASPFHRCIRGLILWKPDIVHSQCEFSTFFLARYIARHCRIPLVHTYHTVYENLTCYFSPNVRLGKYLASSFSRSFSRWAVSRTDCTVAPTEKIRQLLRQYDIKTPITVIPSGIELQRFRRDPSPKEAERLMNRLDIDAEDRILLYLGRLAEEKNIDELLQLLRLLPSPHLKLLLVGDGPRRKELETMARSFGLAGRVRFAGMVDPGEVPLYYRLGDIFVSASRNETQGLTYMEAMASGLPVLCRQDSCLDGVIQDGVNGFLYRTPEEFCRIVCRLLREDSRRLYVGRRAAETIDRNYSSENFALRISGLYAFLSQSPQNPHAGTAQRHGDTAVP